MQNWYYLCQYALCKMCYDVFRHASVRTVYHCSLRYSDDVRLRHILGTCFRKLLRSINTIFICLIWKGLLNKQIEILWQLKIFFGSFNLKCSLFRFRNFILFVRR